MMDYGKCIQDTIDYIEEHLEKPLTLHTWLRAENNQRGREKLKRHPCILAGLSQGSANEKSNSQQKTPIRGAWHLHKFQPG